MELHTIILFYNNNNNTNIHKSIGIIVLSTIVQSVQQISITLLFGFGTVPLFMRVDTG